MFFVVVLLLTYVALNRNPKAANQRTLLENHNYQEVRDEIGDETFAALKCDLNLRENLPADEYIPFEHEDFEITLDLPFNKAWGGESFFIPPYEIIEIGTSSPRVSFGPIKNGGHDCSFFRYFDLSIDDAINPDVFADRLIDKYEYDPEADYNDLVHPPTFENIGGITIGSYQITGACATNHAVIFGKEHNYLLDSSCESFIEEEELLNIARTARFKQ